MGKLKTGIEKRKPIRAYFELKSVRRGHVATPDGGQIECRVPEGYGYVNAWVGDGYNLKRSSMVAATEDYMAWGAVREMHQPSAVGTALGRVTVIGDDGEEEELALGVTWDEHGAWLRSAVVDPDAILKLDAGVYKGYSVGIRAVVMRGQDVEQCLWIENSLVDRPADPDARIELIRAKGVDLDAEADVIRYWDEDDNWVEGAFTFATMEKQLANQDLMDDLYSAWYVLQSSWRSILQAKADVSLFAQSLDEFAAYVKANILTEWSAERALKVETALVRFEKLREAETTLTNLTRQQEAVQIDLTRVQGQLETGMQQVQTLTQEATALRSERDTLRSDLTKAQEEIKRLNSLADPRQQVPVRYGSVERQFALNQDKPQDTELAKLREEFSTLSRTTQYEPDDKKRRDMALRIGQLKLQIAALENS